MLALHLKLPAPSPAKPPQQIFPDDQMRTMSAGPQLCMALLCCLQAFLPLLRQSEPQKARIINISSVVSALGRLLHAFIPCVLHIFHG